MTHRTDAIGAPTRAPEIMLNNLLTKTLRVTQVSVLGVVTLVCVDKPEMKPGHRTQALPVVTTIKVWPIGVVLVPAGLVMSELDKFKARKLAHQALEHRKKARG